MFSNDDNRRQVRQLEARIEAMERELAGLRSERRARLGAKRTRFKGVVSAPGGIPAGGSGQVTIYKNQLPTTWKPTAWHVWMHGGTPVLFNTEVIVDFWPDENRFELSAAACEAGGAHAPLT